MALKSIKEIIMDIQREAAARAPLQTIENMPDVTQKKSCKNSLTGLAQRGYSAPVKRKALTAQEVIALLKKKQGTRLDSEFAADLGITHAYLCDLYKGRRTPGGKILSQLGLVKRQPEPVYEVA